MTFDEILAQVRELLQRQQRLSYRALKRRFALDDEYQASLQRRLFNFWSDSRIDLDAREKRQCLWQTGESVS